MTVYALVGLTGTRLRTDTLHVQWQLLPLDELTAHPFSSTWYLHVQPPLWNVTIGVLARWSPLPLAVSLQALMLVSGAVLAGCTAAVMRRLRLPPAAAVVLALLSTVNSSVLYSGFRARYELPVAALVMASVWAACSNWAERPRRAALLTATLLTMLGLTRSLYHPVFVVAVLGGLLWLNRAHLTPRLAAAALSIPVVLLGGWMAKNQVMFGTPTVSSWSGMNLLRSVQPALTEDDIAQSAAAGEVSDIGRIGAFASYETYAPFVDGCRRRHSDPALTIEMRAPGPNAQGFDATTTPNFNDECFLPLYRQAGADARSLMVNHPAAWVRARYWSVNNWLGEASDDVADGPVSQMLRPLNWLVVVPVAHPGLPVPEPADRLWARDDSISLTVLVATPFVIVAGLRALWRSRRHAVHRAPPAEAAAHHAGPDEAAAVWITAGLIVGWTAFAGITFELGEQARLRSPIDPLLIALPAAAAVGWWRQRRVAAAATAAAQPLAR
jgi:hypothetical protein